MHSPVIAFSILAATAVSPILVSAAPAPASLKLENAIPQTAAGTRGGNVVNYASSSADGVPRGTGVSNTAAISGAQNSVNQSAPDFIGHGQNFTGFEYESDIDRFATGRQALNSGPQNFGGPAGLSFSGDSCGGRLGGGLEPGGNIYTDAAGLNADKSVTSPSTDRCA